LVIALVAALPAFAVAKIVGQAAAALKQEYQ
jgi:hypothetical protein